MRNRLIALCIAFIGGAFGLHRFYLGQNFAGILYLLFSWTGLPFVLTIFDFLGLVFMSDESFNRQFNGIAEPPKFSAVNSRQESSREIAATLGELKKLYDNGVITAEEYEVKRRKLLDSI